MRNCTLVVLFNDKNQILLCMKKRGFGVGKWNGAGGKVDAGETILRAAVRELEEETMITLSESDLTVRGILHFRFENKPEWDQSVHLYTGIYNGSFEETEEMKPQWFNIDQIPYDEMWDDDKIWLPRVISGENVEYNFNFDENGKIINYELIK